MTRERGFFQHPAAIVESSDIGDGTRVWAFPHVLSGASIGSDCNICDGVFIENDVVVGNRVTVKCGVQLWDGVVLEDDVFVGPNVTFTNDRAPRSRHRPPEYLKTRVCAGASLGANSTILPGLTIGRRAMVGAGAVVTRDVQPFARVVGNPARVIGFEDESGPRAGQSYESEDVARSTPSSVPGVSLFRLKGRQMIAAG